MLIALLGEGNFNLEILEQPLTSIMNEHKRFSLLSWEHLETWMGMFGAPTPKPTRIFTTDLAAIIGLKRTMPQHIREKLFHDGAPKATYSYFKDGRVKTQPNVKVMKESQKYPEQYGREVICEYLSWRAKQPSLVDIESSDSDYEVDSPPCWPEARLGPLTKTMLKRQPCARGHF